MASIKKARARDELDGGRTVEAGRLTTQNHTNKAPISQKSQYNLTGRQAAWLARLASRRPREFARIRARLGLSHQPLLNLSRGDAGRLIRLVGGRR